MRKKMKEELLAQMEFNAQNMMSWDEKVGKCLFSDHTLNFSLSSLILYFFPCSFSPSPSIKVYSMIFSTDGTVSQ